MVILLLEVVDFPFTLLPLAHQFILLLEVTQVMMFLLQLLMESLHHQFHLLLLHYLEQLIRVPPQSLHIILQVLLKLLQKVQLEFPLVLQLLPLLLLQLKALLLIRTAHLLVQAHPLIKEFLLLNLIRLIIP